MNPKETFELLKIRNTSDIISDTFTFIEENFKTLFIGLFYIFLPYFFVFGIIYTPFYYSKNLDPYLPITLSNFFTSLFFVYLVPTISITYIKLHKNNEKTNALSLWKNSKKYLTLIIGPSILITIIISFVSYFLTNFYLINSLIPLILLILSIRFLLFFQFIILEDLDLIRALNKSFILTKNEFGDFLLLSSFYI